MIAYDSNRLFTGRNEVGQGNIVTSGCQEFWSQRGVCLSACWDTPPSPGADSPGADPPRADPPRADTPSKSRHPPEQTPPGADTSPEQTPSPGADTPPGADPPWSRPPGADTSPREADCSIRSTSGRYASYWNAFLSLK